jgi:hypothetical protein
MCPSPLPVISSTYLIESNNEGGPSDTTSLQPLLNTRSLEEQAMCPTRRRWVMEDVLGTYALVSTMLMSLAIVVWFSCSIAISLAKARQQHKKLRYKALLRENRRLRSLLANPVKEQRPKTIHRTEIVRRKRNHPRRNVA